ncbi:hypothetical protein SDDV_ORF008 [Scale drop disease virus]|nr:hypothetical protein SDDV_ORF008 [Scale drop disease virus]
MLLTAILWCGFIGQLACLDFKSTEVTDQFNAEEDQQCYIQETFGASTVPKHLSDSSLSIQVGHRGLLLSADYVGESKQAIKDRIDESLKSHLNTMKEYFTNYSKAQCIVNETSYYTIVNGTLLTGSFDVFFLPNVSINSTANITIDYIIVIPNVDVAQFNVTVNADDCVDGQCTISNVTSEECTLLSITYSISLSVKEQTTTNNVTTSNLILQLTTFLQQILITLVTSDGELGTSCDVNCTDDNNSTISVSPNTYYSPYNETDLYEPRVHINNSNGNCTTVLQRAVKLPNETLVVQTLVSNITHLSNNHDYSKCNDTQPNYLQANYYDFWKNASFFQTLLNITHCNETYGPVIFSLYMQHRNDSLMLLNTTFPIVIQFQDYNNPLRIEDITYVHCQNPLALKQEQHVANTTRRRRSLNDDHVDRTSNYMMCRFKGYDDTDCAHLNNRAVRKRRSPPSPPPQHTKPIRVSAEAGGGMQRINRDAIKQARENAKNMLQDYSRSISVESRDYLTPYSQEARKQAYARANQPFTPGGPSPIPRSPLNQGAGEVIYSQVRGAPPPLPGRSPAHVTYGEFSIGVGRPVVPPRPGAGEVIYSQVRGAPPPLPGRSPAHVTYSELGFRERPPQLPPRDYPVGGDVPPPLPPPRTGGAPLPPPRTGGLAEVPPPLPPPRSGSAPPPLPPPRTGGGPAPNPKIKGFFDKFKIPKKTGGCGPKRSVCQLGQHNRPFRGRSSSEPMLSGKARNIMDPDMDGVYGVGKSQNLGGGEHVQVMKRPKGGKFANSMNNGGMMMGAMMMGMMSHQLSSSTRSQVNDIVTGKYANMDQGRATALVVLQKLDEIGGAMVMGGGMAAMMGGGPAALAVAAVGLATQMIVGLITMSMQIYDIRFPRDPPPDPILEKYTEYATMMNSIEAGNVWCLMSESVLHVTISFDDTTTKVKKNSTELWVPTYKTVIKVGYNPDIIFNAELQITCAGGGQLRFDDFNINSVAYKISSTSSGSSVYQVTGIGSMISTKSLITGTCGGSREPNLIIKKEMIASSEMVLLRKRGPGEPIGTENMHSDVCDQFPFKKFYIASPGCSADRSKTHIGWTTCSMLFRKAVWNSVDNMWMVANPFVSSDSDRKIFVFKKRDFRNSFSISPNQNKDHALLCNNADQPFLCRLPDPMIVTDNRMCNNKIRFFRVYLKSGDIKGYSSQSFTGYMLTCPLNTIAMHIMKKGQESTNLVVRNVDTFGSVRKFFLLKTTEQNEPIVWIFCKHSTKVGHESDIIELQLDKTDVDDQKVLNVQTKWLNDDHTRFSMYKISRTGPRYQGPYVYTDAKKLPDYRKHIHLTKAVNVFVSGGSNNIDEEWSLTELENHWNSGGSKSWDWAMQGCKTISSLQVTFGLCNISRTGELQSKPLGWWTWSFLDQTQQGSTTKYIPSHDWYLKPGKDNVTIESTSYEHKMKGCSVKLSLPSRKLHISCDYTDITSEDLNSEVTTCLTVSPANDQCNTYETACGTRSWEWNSLESKRTQWESGERYTANWHNTPGSEPQLAYNFFCQDEGVYWSHIDPYNRYSVLLYTRPLDANLPVIASYQSGNTLSTTDYVIEASKLKIVEKLQRDLSRLFDMTKDPMADAINQFSQGLLGLGQNVTRINIDINDLVVAKQIRDNAILNIQTEMDNMLTDLMLESIKHTEWYKNEIEMARYKCCYVSLNNTVNDTILTVRSIDNDIYQCPDPVFFFEDHIQSNMSRIMGPDGEFYDRKDLLELFGSQFLTCPPMQDFIFADNETLIDFKEKLLSELTQEELVLLADNLTANIGILLAMSQDLPQDDMFHTSKYTYSVSPYDYQLQIDRELNRRAILLICFTFFAATLITVLVPLLKYKRRRIKGYSLMETRSNIVSSRVDIANILLDTESNL